MKYLYFGLISGTLIILDQVSKALIMAQLPLHKSIAVIPGLFNLTHVHNPGGAFGFLASNAGAWLHWLFLGAALVAMILIVCFYHKTPRNKLWLRFSLD